MDFAVVVGVARYPQLSAEGVATDLDGPNNDALSMHNWLVDPAGGRLDPANVRFVRSADFDPLDPDNPQPAKWRIENELKWVEAQTRATTGDRLYLYFSGHGFSPILEEGALFTADATLASPEYVYAHAWMRWFRQAKRFRETVLWMDSCMNYQQSIPVTEVLMRTKVGTGVPGPTFIALAAQTKSALEYAMPDGQVHGVFTWTLLQGLRGGAADERGRVTAESLRNFLYTVMPEFLPTSARSSMSVDLQPFVRADEGMVFRRLPARPKYPVRLVLPESAVGHELRVWTGRPLTQAVSVVLADKEWHGELLRGLYVAEVTEAGLRHGFQVSGAGAVEEVVSRTGPPVVVPDSSELFTLEVVPDNAAAAISVMDYRFERIFRETGGLTEQDISGVYKIRVDLGRDLTLSFEEVLLLDRNTKTTAAVTQELLSPAPIPGTAATHEFHVDPFEQAAVRTAASAGPASGRSMISLLVRYWTEPGAAPPSEMAPDGTAVAGQGDTEASRATPDAAGGGSPVRRHPMEGLQLLDAQGQPVADLAQDCRVEHPDDADPVALWERELAPGPYFLRQVLPTGRQYEGCLIAAADWVTQVAVQRVPPSLDVSAAAGSKQDGGTGPDTAGQTNEADPIADVAVFMRQAGVSREPGQDAVIEGARLALAQGRDLFTEGRGVELSELLLAKFTDPIAGMIGAHLLLRARNPSQPDPVQSDQYDAAVRHLRSLLGSSHPDVEALSLRCSDPTLRATEPFTVPPMFRQSWQLITEASYGESELVPVELWGRVHAATSLGAFFVWAADDVTRAQHAEQLSRWIGQYELGRGAMQEQVPEDARPDRGIGRPPADQELPQAQPSTPAGVGAPRMPMQATPGPAVPQAPRLPEAAREDAVRLLVPASAAQMLWDEREAPPPESAAPAAPSPKNA